MDNVKQLHDSPECAKNADVAETAGFANFDEIKVEDDKTVESNSGTPMIPDEVYEKLPEFLKSCCSKFSGRERDIFLMAAIGVLSGCFPEVSGVYDKRRVFANLFVFIVGPPGSGKGVISFAKQLAEPLHDKLVSEEARRLFIPGNSSAAAIIQLLHESQGKAIICETEADTLSGSLKQDWGNFSEMLRKCFHHESISYARKMDKQYLSMPRPAMSIALAGTPSQVPSLIQSTNDGFFSRWLFYRYNVESFWKDVFAEDDECLTDFFEEKGQTVLEMVEYIQSRSLTFVLRPEQKEKFNSFFAGSLFRYTTLWGEDLDSAVKRMGVITFRIAMTLSLIRTAETQHGTDKIVCDDDIFNLAMEIAKNLMRHTVAMYQELPKTGGLKGNKARFYQAIPNTFSRTQGLAIGKQVGISTRSVDDYLSQFQNSGLLENVGTGLYRKTHMS